MNNKNLCLRFNAGGLQAVLPFLGKLILLGFMMFTPLTGPSYGNSIWGSAAWDARPPGPAEIEEFRLKFGKKTDVNQEDFFSIGANEGTFVSHGRPRTEWMAWELAHLFSQSGDIEYANRVEQLLLGLASRQMPEPPQPIHVEGKWLPYPGIIAFGILKEAGYWANDMKTPDGAYQTLEQWLREYGVSFEQLIERPGQVTNYTPFGLKPFAVLGLVLEEPDYLNLAYDIANRLAFSPEFWHADHIWQEGTVSYARQVSGNLRAMIPALEAGLSFDSVSFSKDGLNKLGERLDVIDEAQRRFSMPSGRAIPVNDTHWGIGTEAIPRAPRSIEFPDFGHFALPGHDIEAHLSIPILTGGGRYGGGHYHDSILSLQFWGHGQELLPDAGYPFLPANNRYFHMSPYAHNMAIVDWDDVQFPRDGEWGVWGGSWARSSLLGYESGVASNYQVNYILGRSLGPEDLPKHFVERMLIQVSTGPWSGYLIDVVWVQGGDNHLSFLRQTEDEEVEQTTNAVLLDAGMNLAEVIGSTEGPAYMNWAALLKNPKRIQATNGFSLSWKGQESGVVLNAHFAPQEGSESWISQMPRLRPTNQDPKLRDAFPGYHLTRQRKVDSEAITVWAAVYEPVRPDEKPKIAEITWHRRDDGVLIEVTSGSRHDQWIIGRPDQATEIDGFRLTGRSAGFSISNGMVDWKWAALGSSLELDGKSMIEAPESNPMEVISLSPSAVGWELVVDGAMDLPESKWALLEFADGSGRAIELADIIEKNGSSTVFLLEKNPGMVIDQSGMQRRQFPLKQIPGATMIRPLGAYFNKP